jgi:lipoprotein-releasing system permease protein
MLKLFLWLRYLHKKKIVFLSITAVALSVALLVVVSSLFTAFIDAYERAAVEALGDVVLFPPFKFGQYDKFIERLEETGTAEAATAVVEVPGLLHLGKGNVRAVIVWGIEPGRRDEVTGFKRFLRRQKDLAGAPSFEAGQAGGQIGGFVGVRVVAEPNDKTDEYDFAEIEKTIGQQVILTTGAVTEAGDLSPGEGDTNRQFRRRTVPFTVADIVYTGVDFIDKTYIFLPIEELQKILYPNEQGPVADQIQIKLKDGSDADVAIAKIWGLWEQFASEQLGWSPHLIRYTNIDTAKRLQSRYVAAYRKQMRLLWLIFGVVSLGVVLLVFCIFYMIVTTKQKDIAIIKSCGGASSSVAWIFVVFGGCVGIIGSAFGTVIGCIITKNVNTIEEWIRIIFGLKLWKSSVYMFSKIPNEVNWDLSLRIVALAVIAVVLGALIPAIIATLTKPVNILRYE